MKLTTFSYRGRTRIGTIEGDSIRTVAWQDSMRQLIRRGIKPSPTYERAIPLAEANLHAPLIPGKIIAIGRNYAEHAAETGSPLPDKPIIFAKFPSSVIGPGDAITWRESITTQVDWEVELAVIIGQRAREVSEEEAMNYVYGYCVANDVTARDLQQKIDAQWTRGKSLDTFCPLGPYIVTRDEIADPQNLAVKTTVNDKVMQESNTKHMIFNVKHLISYSSQMFTLEPGDMILTGTPDGVGMGRKPPVFLKDGDVVTVSVEGIGEVSNPCKVIAE
jgi:2-keto-4-pentenoate hydratase/2-oxohepta-3-ene-1,7-dioic acid hydratase in catechol pathway